jgi:hypothetical protein
MVQIRDVFSPDEDDGLSVEQYARRYRRDFLRRMRAKHNARVQNRRQMYLELD